MQFVDLSIRNFRSHEESKYKFKDKGLTLIEGNNEDEGGSNGAGKSSIWDAICWCLFGETTGGIKGDEVVNRKTKKNCRVFVRAIVNGKMLTVVRYRKDKDNKNDLLFTYDDEKPVCKGTTALTQKYLLEEIGIDLDLFRTTVLFAQGDMFNFVDETDKKQKEILGKIVRISFDDLQRKAKEKLKAIELEVDMGQKNIDKLEARKEASNLNMMIEAEKTFEEDRKREITGVLNLIKETQSKIDELKFDDQAMLEKAVKDIETKVEELREKETDLQRKRDRVNMKYEEIEKKVRQTKLLGPSCDKCGQEISAEEKKKTLIGYVSDLKKLKDLRDKIPLTTDLVKKRRELSEKIPKLKDRIEETQRNTLRKESLEKYIEEKKNEIKTIKAKKNDWKDQIDEENKKLSDISKAIKTFQETMAELQEGVAYWTFWVNGFGDKGIKSFIFDTVCGQLTAKANHYLGLLSNGSMSVQFDTQTKLKSGEIREKFEVVVTKDGNNVKYAEFSGGEKRRISLAVDMALAELMKDFYDSDFNVVVFDEQTNFMDKEGRECYLTLLKEQAREKAVFVVDHDAEFKALFDDVVTITKSGGISRIA